MKKLKKYIAFVIIMVSILCKKDCVKAYEWAISPQFYRAKDFSEGFAVCDPYSYCIDYKENVLIDGTPKYLGKFSYDAAVCIMGGYYKLCDKLGNLHDVDKDMVLFDFSDGLSRFYLDSSKLYGFLDKEFKICIEPIYDDASDFEEGYAVIKQKEMYGYINRLGEVIIKPQFKMALNFSNGIAAVESTDGLWGYIDYKGNYVIQPKYTEAEQFHDGHAIVATEDKKGFIDINENFIEVSNDGSQRDFSEGVSVISYYYNPADSKTNGLRYGLINNNGEYILLPEYDYLSDCNEGIIAASKDKKYFILDSSGNVLEEFKEAPPELEGYTSPYLSNSHENLIAAAFEKDGYPMWGYLKNPIATPSDWAKDEIESSFMNGIVPHYIAYNYQNNITRKEFCTLLVKMIERALNMTIPIESRDVFADTKDINILKLYYAGVIKGVDGNIFAPDDFITREQAARILMYAGVYMGVPYDKDYTNVYEDENEISDWAKESTNLLYHNDIMKGTNNKFSPKENFTREQSIVSVYKLYKKII